MKTTKETKFQKSLDSNSVDTDELTRSELFNRLDAAAKKLAEEVMSCEYLSTYGKLCALDAIQKGTLEGFSIL